MFSIWCLFGILVVTYVPCIYMSCTDSNALSCAQWGLARDNECITNPGYVACYCKSSCGSLNTCAEIPGIPTTNDTDCNCRDFAKDGFMDSGDKLYYQTTCPTTFHLRHQPGISCDGNLIPNNITNGVLEASAIPTKPTYKYMDQVQFDCVPGFKHSGHDRPTMTCNRDGTWYWGAQTGNATCVPITNSANDTLTEIDDFEPSIKEAKGAAIFGGFGILVIIGVIGFIVWLDCLSCKKHFARGKRNTRIFRRWLQGKRNKQTDTQESPIGSADLKTIETETSSTGDPCCSSRTENETAGTSTNLTEKGNTPSTPTNVSNGKVATLANKPNLQKTSNGAVSKGKVANGIGKSMKGIAGSKGHAANTVAPSSKKNGVNPQAKTNNSNKPTTKKPVAKPKQFVPKTRWSVV